MKLKQGKPTRKEIMKIIIISSPLAVFFSSLFALSLAWSEIAIVALFLAFVISLPITLLLSAIITISIVNYFSDLETTNDLELTNLNQ